MSTLEFVKKAWPWLVFYLFGLFGGALVISLSLTWMGCNYPNFGWYSLLFHAAAGMAWGWFFTMAALK